jgi:hypothetical protein
MYQPVKSFILTFCFLIPSLLSFDVISRNHGPRGFANHPQDGEHRGGPLIKRHTITKKSPLCLIPASIDLYFLPKTDKSMGVDGVTMRSNGIPNHAVGKFPNCGNPHTIEEQHHVFQIKRNPGFSSSTNSLENGWAFGVAINGIPWEPLAAEYYKGNRNSNWRYEALSGAISLGVDENYAHVQPGGKYHYHGLPWGLMTKINITKDRHSPVIGWAADGFPIYALYGSSSKKGGVVEYQSSYRLKVGLRPSGDAAPGGNYDGSFTADYEYVKGVGNLDQCNGIQLKTPEFPGGTYAYFLSKNFPIVPRCHKGSPDNSFNMRKAGPPHRRPMERPRGSGKPECGKC